MCRDAFVLGLPCLRGSIFAWQVVIADAVNQCFHSRYVGGHSDDTGVNILEVVLVFLGGLVPLEVLLVPCSLLFDEVALEGDLLAL